MEEWPASSVKAKVTKNSCKEIPPAIPDLPDEATIRSIISDSTMLPLFYMEIFDRMHQKSYSLVTNDRLRCQWMHYPEFYFQEAGKRQPYKFPSAHDYHFYNHINRYAPEQSVKDKDFRRHTMRHIQPNDRTLRPVGLDINLHKSKPKPKSGRKKPLNK